ncbi:MAG: hypothetical protein QXJ64_02975 [Thermosphaera sp.]
MTSLRVSSKGQTRFIIVVVDRNGDIIMYGYKGVAEELGSGDIVDDMIANAIYIHIANLRVDTSLRVVETARKSNIAVTWGPGRVLSTRGIRELESLIKQVNIIAFNSKEAALLTGLKPEEYREVANTIKSLGPELG